MSGSTSSPQARAVRIAGRWRDPDYGPRRDAVKALAREAGFPPAMSAEILGRLFAKFTRAGLGRLAKRPPAYLAGPGRTGYIFPSNVPDPLVVHTLLSVSRGKPAWIKLSRRSSRFGRAFLRSLSLEDPRLKDRIRFTLSQKEFFDRLGPADPVVAYGGDATVREVRRKAGKRRVYGFGHRISAGIVFRSAMKKDPDRLAAVCARDVWLYDQRGCLSPRMYFVQGDPHGFAGRLSAGLAALERKHGPVRRPKELALDRRIFRDRLTAEELAGRAAVAAAAGQVVGVKRFRTLLELRRGLRGTARFLACVSVAGTPAERRLVEREFKNVRVCPAGSSQRPPLDWNLEGESHGI